MYLTDTLFALHWQKLHTSLTKMRWTVSIQNDHNQSQFSRTTSLSDTHGQMEFREVMPAWANNIWLVINSMKYFGFLYFMSFFWCSCAHAYCLDSIGASIFENNWLS